MLAGSHRNAWPDETGTGGRTNRNTHLLKRRVLRREGYSGYRQITKDSYLHYCELKLKNWRKGR